MHSTMEVIDCPSFRNGKYSSVLYRMCARILSIHVMYKAQEFMHVGQVSRALLLHVKVTSIYLIVASQKYICNIPASPPVDGLSCVLMCSVFSGSTDLHQPCFLHQPTFHILRIWGFAFLYFSSVVSGRNNATEFIFHLPFSLEYSLKNLIVLPSSLPNKNPDLQLPENILKILKL